LKGPRELPEANHGPGGTPRTWWATDVVPPAASLAGRQAGKAEWRVVAADGFMDVGCSEPPSDFALALAVLSRSRLAVVVTGLSKLDGIAKMEAPAKFLA